MEESNDRLGAGTGRVLLSCAQDAESSEVSVSFAKLFCLRGRGGPTDESPLPVLSAAAAAAAAAPRALQTSPSCDSVLLV